MTLLKSLARRYARYRDETDPYLMAAALALAGEPDLAREILVEGDEAQPRCGSIDEGDDGCRFPEVRRTLAVETAS